MSDNSVKQEVSYKSVLQECLTRALRNSVKQGCPTRVPPQCVHSVCLTSEFAGNVTNKYCLCLSTYMSAFGFVGFILFWWSPVVVPSGASTGRTSNPDGALKDALRYKVVSYAKVEVSDPLSSC